MAGVHFIWAPIHWENRCTLAACFEDIEGEQWHTDQAIAPACSPGSAFAGVNDTALEQWSGKMVHKLVFEPGTRRAASAEIRMQDKSGQSLEISLEPVLLFRMKGIGYQHPEWGHGKWKGELAIGGESWDCDGLDPLTWENIHIQQLVVARCGDEVGYGVLEQMHIGPYATYGFKEYFDGA